MVSHIVLLYNKIIQQIMFSFQGGPSENDISVDIIYLITNKSCHHVLTNDKKCFETNLHEKFKLKLFNRRMLLQDSKENVLTFHKCQDIIPKTLELQNISPKFSNIYLVLFLIHFSRTVSFLLTHSS